MIKPLCSVVGIALAVVAQGSDLKGKKLIEFGWDEPGTGFLRTNIQQLQRTPFDGCVFHADYRKADGSNGKFSWQPWGEQTFTEADLKEAFDDLRAARFGRTKYNFLRFNTTPARLDWFDDYRHVLANAELAARLAKAGRCPGLLFDIEQYEGLLFNYRKQRDAGSKSWELYAARTRKRGAEVMAAFQKGYPGLAVFLTFGYSLPWAESDGGKRALADCSYGLLAPFLDGMLQTAHGRTRIIDGHELSYSYMTAAKFAKARKVATQDLLPIVRDPAKFKEVCRLSFGLWMDYDWRKIAWNTEDFSKNYFSPDAFETAVGEALRASDEFVWIYTETPRWWSAEGGPVKLPAAYDQALHKARAEK